MIAHGFLAFVVHRGREPRPYAAMMVLDTVMPSYGWHSFALDQRAGRDYTLCRTAAPPLVTEARRAAAAAHA
jgi:hypothetical protein